ncbi:MAG: hypothetical protein ACREIS_02275 [Nitrospiraceae bacterium]
MNLTLFPIQRPRLGLSIDARTLSMLEVQRDWRRGWRDIDVRLCGERTLPAGLVTLSATELNVSDVAALAGEVRALRGNARNALRVASVALSLPDLCARVALFEFEVWPNKPAECDALLRWRFQKDLGMPATGARLAFRVFPPTPGPSAGGAHKTHRVLAATIQARIIEQYEQVCQEAGLIPVSLGVSSLRLFDLCRPFMAAPRGNVQYDSPAPGQAPGMDPSEFFFLHVAQAGFSFFALRYHCPVFHRIKPLRNGHTNLVDELRATVQFYDESRPAARNGCPALPRPLFIVGAEDPCSDGQRPGEQVAPDHDRDSPEPGTTVAAQPVSAMLSLRNLIDPDLAASLRLKMVPVGWNSLLNSRNGQERPEAQARPLSALAALAGVWEA